METNGNGGKRSGNDEETVAIIRHKTFRDVPGEMITMNKNTKGVLLFMVIVTDYNDRFPRFR